jgi:catechol 2,3-dioxygenase-like lactoylglutathione lyase family enzyme
LRDFYCGVIGLSVGQRPPFKSAGFWLYADDRDILHLTVAGETEVRSTSAVTTIDHVAFSCAGLAAYEGKLQQLGIPYEIDRVPLTGQVQLFLRDPAGNGVELNFSGGDA